jgi:recombination protein U
LGTFSHGNRGMNIEEDINLSNDVDRANGLCLITKRPTPINVVKVDYSKGAIITNAYFEKQSTTDYNGVYKGRYIDFEAKSTLKITSFPLANISEHQIEHLKQVLKHGGIAFFIIEFAKLNQVYLLDASYVIDFYENGERKSIPFKDVQEHGFEIKKGFAPRLNYLDVIDKIYVNS